MTDPDFAKDVEQGLTAPNKNIPPKWLYDDRGSKLFEQITKQPEYYLTDAERQILQDYAPNIVNACPSPLCLIELGSGSANKTHTLIDAILQRQDTATYTPIDISDKGLQMAKERFKTNPRVTVKPLQGTFQEGLRTNPSPDEARLIAFIGSSIGNMPLPSQETLLSNIQATMRPNDRLLLGTDLVKDQKTLLQAYDDEEGITEAFTLNLLARINRELGGTFNLDAFQHTATYNETKAAIVIYAESLQDQTVTIHDLDLTLHFQEGERIHTEDSHKYTPQKINRLLHAANLTREQTYHDEDERFALHLLQQAH